MICFCFSIQWINGPFWKPNQMSLETFLKISSTWTGLVTSSSLLTYSSCFLLRFNKQFYTQYKVGEVLPTYHQPILGDLLGVLQFNLILTLEERVRSWGVQGSGLPLTQRQMSAQVQVVSCASDQLAVNPRFPSQPPWIQWVTHRIQRNISLTRLPVYYRRL